MSLSMTHKALLRAYSALWTLARPILEKNKRLKHGLTQRYVPNGWASRCDVWIQAASGGEAYLVWELLKRFPERQRVSLLLTSCTKQGMEILEQAKSWAGGNNGYLDIQLAYFPFDKPALMAKALNQAAPKAVAMMETELWPGLLTECKKSNVPVMVLNGRMTPRSLAGYLATAGLWRAVAPSTVLAMSENDARRYAALFGEQGVHMMNNIKFDRVALDVGSGKNPLVGTVVKKGAPVVTFGSVREEEEADVMSMIASMRAARPKTTIALIPRHMERVDAWEARLRAEGIDVIRRSAIEEMPAAGMVVLWDVFGELDAVYGISRAVFVGGSLAPLGGQNFLEPLAHGIIPVTGCSLENFAWASGLIDENLVQVQPDADAAFEQLLRNVKRPTPQDKVKERFAKWVGERQGGSQAAVDALLAVIGN